MRGTKERRSILMAKIQIDEAVVTVINTHLGKSTNERKKQVPILLNTLNQYGQPSILAGDFNMEMADSLMKPFNFHWQKIELQENHPTFKTAKRSIISLLICRPNPHQPGYNIRMHQIIIQSLHIFNGVSSMTSDYRKTICHKYKQ